MDKNMSTTCRYGLGCKYFRKELGEADFFVIITLVNTVLLSNCPKIKNTPVECCFEIIGFNCCLTTQNSKWSLSSVFNFTCLAYWDFGYHMVPQWYPNYYHVKVWCLSFQMPCCIHFFDVWLSSSYQLHFEFRTWFLLKNGITSMRPFVQGVKHDRKTISMNHIGTSDTAF